MQSAGCDSVLRANFKGGFKPGLDGKYGFSQSEAVGCTMMHSGQLPGKLNNFMRTGGVTYGPGDTDMTRFKKILPGSAYATDTCASVQQAQCHRDKLRLGCGGSNYDRKLQDGLNKLSPLSCLWRHGNTADLYKALAAGSKGHTAQACWGSRSGGVKNAWMDKVARAVPRFKDYYGPCASSKCVGPGPFHCTPHPERLGKLLDPASSVTPNDACKKKTDGFVLADAYVGTGFCTAYPLLPKAIRESTQIESLLLIDPRNLHQANQAGGGVKGLLEDVKQGIRTQPEVCKTMCYPNADVAEVHTRVACTKLCTIKAADRVTQQSALCYIHKLMHCECRDGAMSAPKLQPCGKWACNVKKTAYPVGEHPSLCREKVMSM